jgi:hypothetical protein
LTTRAPQPDRARRAQKHNGMSRSAHQRLSREVRAGLYARYCFGRQGLSRGAGALSTNRGPNTEWITTSYTALPLSVLWQGSTFRPSFLSADLSKSFRMFFRTSVILLSDMPVVLLFSSENREFDHGPRSTRIGGRPGRIGPADAAKALERNLQGLSVYRHPNFDERTESAPERVLMF